jgi:hypothetical protein
MVGADKQRQIQLVIHARPAHRDEYVAGEVHSGVSELTWVASRDATHVRALSLSWTTRRA